jgi:outer membrane protein insertion porin family
MSAFLDMGFAADNKFDFGQTRASAGISALWVSPMGPLKVSIAAPFKSEQNDRKQYFQFTFGGAF